MLVRQPGLGKVPRRRFEQALQAWKQAGPDPKRRRVDDAAGSAASAGASVPASSGQGATSQRSFDPGVAGQEMQKAGVGAPELPSGLEHHFFLSHYQATGGDQVDGLHQELKARGFSCWYDNRMTNLTKQGMADGVRSSAVFVLFLSKDVLQRPFVRFEIGEALKHSKQILLLFGMVISSLKYLPVCCLNL